MRNVGATAAPEDLEVRKRLAQAQVAHGEVLRVPGIDLGGLVEDDVVRG